MKISFAISCTLFFLCKSTVPQSVFTDLQTPEAIRDSAQSQNKNVFILYEMSSDTTNEKVYDFHFSDSALIEKLNAEYIAVRMSSEQDDENYFSKQYNVNAYPSLLFLDARGELIHKRAGIPPDTKGVIDEFKRAESADNSYRALTEKINDYDVLSPELSRVIMRVKLKAGERVDSLFRDYFYNGDTEAQTDEELWRIIIPGLQIHTQREIAEYIKRNEVICERVDSDYLKKMYFNVYRESVSGKAGSAKRTNEATAQLKAQNMPYVAEFERFIEFRRLQAHGDLTEFVNSALLVFEDFNTVPPEVLTLTAEKILGTEHDLENLKANIEITRAHNSPPALLLQALLMHSAGHDDAKDTLVVPDNRNKEIYKEIGKLLE